MKPIMNLEEHNAMKEKRVKKMYEIKMLNLEIIIKIISMIMKKTFMSQFNIK